MQHMIPKSKRCDYSDIPSGGHKYTKGPTHMVQVATTLEKLPTPPIDISNAATKSKYNKLMS